MPRSKKAAAGKKKPARSKRTVKSSRTPIKPDKVLVPEVVDHPGSALAKSQPDDALRLPRGAKVTPTSLELPRTLTLDKWMEAGKTIKFLARGAQWWIGDWLNFGEARYGEKYSQYMNDLGLAYGTLANYRAIAAKFSPERRREKLSFGHHESVLALEDEKEQDELLEQAAKENWTRDRIRKVAKERTNILAASVEEGKSRIDIKIEFMNKPAKEAVDRLKVALAKTVGVKMESAEDEKKCASGTVKTFTWHK